MPNSSTKHKQQGVEILVTGTVQGVGFRPFIYNLASRFSIQGMVSNTEKGVIIRACGRGDRLNSFIGAMTAEAPPLASISSVSSMPAEFDLPEPGFTIVTSSSAGTAATAIPPDIGLCDECFHELVNPNDRRYHYPFINCTNCGPRFSIIETIPYDRPKTSMKVFAMCEACTAEYHDPANRRFHAQPNACPDCGPNVFLCDRKQMPVVTGDPIARSADFLADGKIVAIRGLGGFHLSASGLREEVVQLLRARKGRPEKPLAVMMPDLDTVRHYCEVSANEENILTSIQKPIVLLQKKTGTNLAPGLAPGVAEIGVMLPYTPLHHLLFKNTACPRVLLMTSGNSSGSPICTTNDDALDRLPTIADYFLLHNRDIVTRVDDSVLRPTSESPLIMRRARGFAPAPVEVKWQLPHILGCGGGLKSTFCVGRGKSMFVSQHIGDLDNLEIYDFYVESITHLKKMLQIDPEAVVCDLHPDYLSSRYAQELNLPLYQVQHHHAHAAAVIAEHGLENEVLAVVMDGTGLGTDGTIWGGEILRADLRESKRLAHLEQFHLPGGDTAATEPWRMGIAALFATFGPEFLQQQPLPEALRTIPTASVQVVQAMLKNSFNAPLTSSCGRLFDAVASLMGIRQIMSFEGQAAMELEATARNFLRNKRGNYFDILPSSHSDFARFLIEKDGKWEISSTEFVKMVVDNLNNREPAPYIAFLFHQALVGAIALLMTRLAEQTSIRRVVLAGGCMQNVLLLEGLRDALTAAEMNVYTGNVFPVNDGSISLGQTLIGGLQHVSCNTNESHCSAG